MAVINDSLYSEGEQIPPSFAAVPNCTVARVDFDRVVLDMVGTSAELLYPDPTAPPPAVDSKSPRATNAGMAARQKNGKPAGDKGSRANAQPGGKKGAPKAAEAAPPAPPSADSRPPATVSNASVKTN